MSNQFKIIEKDKSCANVHSERISEKLADTLNSDEVNWLEKVIWFYENEKSFSDDDTIQMENIYKKLKLSRDEMSS